MATSHFTVVSQKKREGSTSNHLKFRFNACIVKSNQLYDLCLHVFKSLIFSYKIFPILLLLCCSVDLMLKGMLENCNHLQCVLNNSCKLFTLKISYKYCSGCHKNMTVPTSNKIKV